MVVASESFSVMYKGHFLKFVKGGKIEDKHIVDYLVKTGAPVDKPRKGRSKDEAPQNDELQAEDNEKPAEGQTGLGLKSEGGGE